MPTMILHAGVKLIDSKDFSAYIGIRIQPRLEIKDQVTPTRSDKQTDFMIRRTRLKISGKSYHIKYKLEWKLDNTDQIGKTSTAQVENAYLELPLGITYSLKMGLFDAAFSRDALTSDSKQASVDRGLTYSNVSNLGLADNVTGINFTGKVNKNVYIYQFGVFDNRKIDGTQQNTPLIVARLDVNLGSTKNIFRDAHFGSDKWYSFAFDFAYQPDIHDKGNSDNAGKLSAYGFDWLYDNRLGHGRLMLRGEINRISEKQFGSILENQWTDWMLVTAYLISEKYQPIFRIDVSDKNTNTEKQYILGFNYYLKQHNLKFQTDIMKKSPTVSDNIDQIRLQFQLDF